LYVVAVVQKFGRIDSVRLMKDRKTGNSRGLAYVRYTRPYDAAIALETCDRSKTPFLLHRVTFCVLGSCTHVLTKTFHDFHFLRATAVPAGTAESAY